jgi:effector-binding domain-containing protein
MWIGTALGAGRHQRECADAYDAVETWLNENRLTPSGIAYEFYLNDPMTTAQDRLETRVLFPLAKREQDPGVGTRS